MTPDEKKTLRVMRSGPKLTGPKRAGAHRRRMNPPNTDFRRFYERGDLPIQINHGGVKSKIHWKLTSPDGAANTEPMNLVRFLCDLCLLD